MWNISSPLTKKIHPQKGFKPKNETKQDVEMDIFCSVQILQCAIPKKVCKLYSPRCIFKKKKRKWVNEFPRWGLPSSTVHLCISSSSLAAKEGPEEARRRVCRAQALYRRGRREAERERERERERGERERKRERERELWQRSSPTEQPGRVASEQSLPFADGVYSLCAAFSFDLFLPHPLPLPVLPSQSTMVSIISDLDPLKSWNVLR